MSLISLFSAIRGVPLMSNSSAHRHRLSGLAGTRRPGQDIGATDTRRAVCAGSAAIRALLCRGEPGWHSIFRASVSMRACWTRSHRSPISSNCEGASRRCFAAITSTPPKIVRCCIPRCDAAARRRSWSTARTSTRRCSPSASACSSLPRTCARAASAPAPMQAFHWW